MKISIRLTEPFWRIVGSRDIVLDVQEKADISDMLGEKEAGMREVLAHQDRVHLVWAVAGG